MSINIKELNFTIHNIKKNKLQNYMYNNMHVCLCIFIYLSIFIYIVYAITFNINNIWKKTGFSVHITYSHITEICVNVYVYLENSSLLKT